MAGGKEKRKESGILIAVVNNHVQSVVHMSNFLEMHGYRTVWAYSGDAAVKLCERERPDLLVLDAQMPGMTGFDVARELPRQKILFTVADRAVAEKAKKFPNCAGTIHKPVDNRELDDFIRSVFGLKKPVLE